MKYDSIPAEKRLAQHENSSPPVTLGVGRIHPRERQSRRANHAFLSELYPVPAPLRGRPHERAARLLPPPGLNLRFARRGALLGRAGHFRQLRLRRGFLFRLYAQMPVLPERRHFAGKPRKRNLNRSSAGNLFKTHRRRRPEHQSRHADALSSVHSPGADTEAPRARGLQLRRL